MSRPTRILQKKFVVFCEGDTEYNYIDRILTNQGEWEQFKKLYEYCYMQNKTGNTPLFLIANNPNFEYVACLHSSDYKGQDEKKFITLGLGATNIAIFKGNSEIYNFLNQGNLSYEIMMKALEKKEKLISNKYEIKKKNFEIAITKTTYNIAMNGKRCSNMEEFFKVIDW
ncbi:MAG: hypothetical protein R3Y24_15020 [Eubacteriales bacterium]